MAEDFQIFQPRREVRRNPMSVARSISFAWPHLALGAAVVLGACGPGQPPGSGVPAAADRVGPCISDEPRLIHYARWLATDTDPRLDVLRRRFQIELVAASEVEQVTDPTVCRRAGSAYRDALDVAEAPDAVAVIRVGNRYIVTSRVGGSTSSEFASAVVLDESLRVLETLRR